MVDIFITDYFVMRRGNIWLADLYTSDHTARYWYTSGFNWRAFVAFFIAAVLPIPGFATLFGQDFAGAQVWLKIYQVGWLIGCVLSSVAYFGLCSIGGFLKTERAMRWEQITDEQVFEQLAKSNEPTVVSDTGSEIENIIVREKEKS